MCPKGDDPNTINQKNKRIFIDINSYGSYRIGGFVGLYFMGETTWINILNDDRNCTETINAQGKLGTVYCDVTPGRNPLRGIKFDIQILKWPTYPRENNFFTHNGNPDTSLFECDFSAITSTFTKCVITDINPDNIEEYEYCSRRGNCDFTKGECECFDGYHGVACNNKTSGRILVEPGLNSRPGTVVNVLSSTYNSTAVSLTSEKSPAPDFYFINASSDQTRDMLLVRGDGLVSMQKLLTIKDGHHLGGGGMFIEYGGWTTVTGGMIINSQSFIKPVVHIESQAAGIVARSRYYSVFNVSADSSNFHSYYLVQMSNVDSLNFDIRGNGKVSMRGGLTIAGASTIYNSGLKLFGGLTVNNNGFKIPVSGLTSTGGMTIHQGGMRIKDLGLAITQGVSVHATGLNVHAGGVLINSGGMRTTTGVTVNTRGLMVTGGMTTSGDQAMVVIDGVTVTAGGVSTASFVKREVPTKFGLLISRSDVQVVAGGLRTNGLATTNGITITNSGTRVTSGITIMSAGLELTGGLTVLDGNMFVFDGMSISSGGLDVERGVAPSNVAGMTVQDTGMVVSNGGAIVTSRASVAAGGITVGSMIVSNRLFVTGGITITGNSYYPNRLTLSGGLIVGGGVRTLPFGMTVYQDTNFQSSPVTFSDRRLKTNIITINDALGKVSQLKGVYFNWIDEDTVRGNAFCSSNQEFSGKVGVKSTQIVSDTIPNSFDLSRHVGLIAQDLMAVLPEVVSRKKIFSNIDPSITQKEYLGVDYDGLVPLLIQALQDLLLKYEKISTNVNRDILDAFSTHQSTNATYSHESKPKNSPFFSEEEEVFELYEFVKKELDELQDENSYLENQVQTLKNKIKAMKRVKTDNTLYSDTQSSRSQERDSILGNNDRKMNVVRTVLSKLNASVRKFFVNLRDTFLRNVHEDFSKCKAIA